MNSTKKSSLGRNLFILSSIAIPLLSFVMFYVIPNFSAFTMAFQTYEGDWTLLQFERVFRVFSRDDGDLRLALRNTLLTFGITVLLYPIKVLNCYFIYKKVPFSGFYRVVFFIPTIVFSVALNLVFTQLVGSNGFIAQWVGELAGLDYTPELLADSRYANGVILSQLVWLALPGDLIIWGGTFTRIPEDVLESGRIDGTTWWTEFTKIVVPMVWPTVGLQMTLMFCGILGAGGSVFLLTGGEYGTMTLSAWLYIQMVDNAGSIETSNALYYMSAVGVCMTVIAVLIGRLVRYIADKAFDEVEF